MNTYYITYFRDAFRLMNSQPGCAPQEVLSEAQLHDLVKRACDLYGLELVIQMADAP